MNDQIADYKFCRCIRFSILTNSDDDEAFEGSTGPVGINEWSPEARRSSSRPK